jgi:hypothetical protein
MTEQKPAESIKRDWFRVWLGMALFLVPLVVAIHPCLYALVEGKPQGVGRWLTSLMFGFGMASTYTYLAHLSSQTQNATTKRAAQSADTGTVGPAGQRRAELGVWVGVCALISLFGVAAYLRTGFPALWQLALLELVCPTLSVIGLRVLGGAWSRTGEQGRQANRASVMPPVNVHNSLAQKDAVASAGVASADAPSPETAYGTRTPLHDEKAVVTRGRR